jgi:hypothetical protein
VVKEEQVTSLEKQQFLECTHRHSVNIVNHRNTTLSNLSNKRNSSLSAAIPLYVILQEQNLEVFAAE